VPSLFRPIGGDQMVACRLVVFFLYFIFVRGVSKVNAARWANAPGATEPRSSAPMSAHNWRVRAQLGAP